VYGIIYKATGPTGLVYVGQTKKTLVRRKNQHKYRAKKGDRRGAFQVAILEHGFDVFVWEQIDQAETPEELDQKEKDWIDRYNSIDPTYGYNNDTGGKYGKHSEETRHKLSKLRMGENSPWFGKHLSEEHRRKISKAEKGRVQSAETRRKISDALKGKSKPHLGNRRGSHPTSETRRKISEALKRWHREGKKPSPNSGAVPAGLPAPEHGLGGGGSGQPAPGAAGSGRDLGPGTQDRLRGPAGPGGVRK
jgi:group I intron endonuclease